MNPSHIEVQKGDVILLQSQDREGQGEILTRVFRLWVILSYQDEKHNI